MQKLLVGMRLKELPVICIGIIVMVAATSTWTIRTFIGHIILFSRELQGMQNLKREIFPTKWGFEIMKIQVGLGA